MLFRSGNSSSTSQAEGQEEPNEVKCNLSSRYKPDIFTGLRYIHIGTCSLPLRSVGNLPLAPTGEKFSQDAEIRDFGIVVDRN